MAIRLHSFITLEQLEDRRFSRAFFNSIIIIAVLTIMILEVLENQNVRTLFDDITDNIIIFTTICYMIAIYSYGYKQNIFKHQWQIFLIMYLAISQAIYVIFYGLYSQYEESTVIYLTTHSFFWVLFYSYVLFTIHNLKHDIA